MADIKLLKTADGVGLRDTIAELLDDLNRKEVNAIVISWRETDKTTTVYWNGDNLECIGLCVLVEDDITSGFKTDKQIDIDPLPKKEDSE